jgi:hypothetical protein
VRVFSLQQKITGKLAFGLGLMIAAAGVAVSLAFSTQKVLAFSGDCSSNAIIYCGADGSSAFISKVKDGNSGNGHHDLATVYAHYGLEPGDYDRFVRSARAGTLYRDGRLVVDGRTVTQANTNTIGRNASAQGSGYFTQNINGTNYYGNSSGATFASGTDSISAMVLFNAKGAVQFAVLTSCGNPIGNTPINPNESCDLLSANAVAGKLNTYSFTTSASAGNGAAIDHVVYNFGDGTTATTSALSTPYEHHYTKAGTVKASVTVYVKLPGAQTITVTSAKCQKTLTIVAPIIDCQQLIGTVDPRNPYGYTFRAKVNYSNGATFNNVTYHFGDGQTAVSHTDGVGVNNNFTKGGNFTATAVFTANLPNGGTASDGTGCIFIAKTPIPVYGCTTMNVPVVSPSNPHTYSFTTAAKASSGANVIKYVYDFGDKSTTNVTSTASNGAISHTYGAEKAYTAKVTVYFERHGDITVTATSLSCQQTFGVVIPICVNLKGTFINGSNVNVQYIATYSPTTGPKPVSADFTFGDGKFQNGVKANTTSPTFTVNHNYAVQGTYDASAVLYFTVTGKPYTAATCKAVMTPTAPPAPSCKPGTPTSSEACTPCQYDNSIPTDSAQCMPVPNLPNTGAGNVVAISAGVAVFAFMVYRQFLFRQHKAAFVAAELGTSALPLGQPLDADAPLAGTPLAYKVRKTFRRNRPY